MIFGIYIMICSACVFTANSLTIQNSLINFICEVAFIVGIIIYMTFQDKHETKIKELQKEIEEIKKEIKK